MTKNEELNSLCKIAKITYDTYSPGDNITRYRFFESQTLQDYFSENGLITCLGIREAIIFVRGYIAGKEYDCSI